MSKQLATVLMDLDRLTAWDFDYSNPSPAGWERLGQCCDELGELGEVEGSVPAMFAFVERLGDVELGTPGPLVHTLEKWRGRYEHQLVESVKRKPSPLTVWMVNRILNAKPPDSRDWIGLLRDVDSHPLASEETKADAKGFLKHQLAS